MHTPFKKTYNEKRHYVTLLFSVPLLAAFMAGISVFAFNPSLKGILLIIALGLYSVFILRSILWELSGKEIIEITDAVLIIERRGSFFIPKEVYNIRDIKDVAIIQKKFRFWEFLVKKGPFITLPSYGPIAFRYEGRSINFGGNISPVEGEEIVALIEANRQRLL
jgi:hypothetical protein